MEDDFYAIIQRLLSEGKPALLIVIAVVQTFSYILKKCYPDKYSGLNRFLFIYITTSVLGTTILRLVGVNWVEAFASANWVAQLQVTSHQLYKTSTRVKK